MSREFLYPHRPLGDISIPRDFTGDYSLGLSTNDATQRHVLGTRNISWDGSVHKYVKAGTAFTSYQLGVWDEAAGGDVAYEVTGTTAVAGASELTITQGSITKDQYAGGYIILFHVTGGGEVYCVRGNDATVGTTTKLYLDRPLAAAVIATDAIELYANPYSTVAQGNSSGTQSFVGVPMALLTDTYFGWVKTWGPAFVAPQSTVGGAYTGGCYWRHDGSIDAAASSGTVTTQYAGYVMTGSAAGNGPLIMLQCSI
jgi:hypothetical protein